MARFSQHTLLLEHPLENLRLMNFEIAMAVVLKMP
jgi:hypothetical protein